MYKHVSLLHPQSLSGVAFYLQISTNALLNTRILVSENIPFTQIFF